MNPKQRENLLKILQTRFENNLTRHTNIEWAKVGAALDANPNALKALQAMQATGGEPDVVGQDKKQIIFYDCSPESPIQRRSVCYDQQALDARKENKPKHSAVGMATEMGIELLTQDQYLHLQTLGEFDLKTSSWIKTPSEMRALEGALFCDRRFGKVFVYHNGVQSYYAGRGFRGMLIV
jgi:Protein of unknown function (DUF4256)